MIGPQFRKLISLCHDISKHAYTRLLALLPTDFNRARMGSRLLGGRDIDGGYPGNLNGNGMVEYHTGGGLGGRLPGSGGNQASCCSAKEHPVGNKKIQKTPRCGAEIREDEADAQGKVGRRTQHHHSGLAGELAAGRGRQGCVCVCVL